jgi:DedD protein
MADTPVSPEELALRRRARRRLVGAIALALLAVVVLPMLFDPEPRPLGSDVEIAIPSPDTPFEPLPASGIPEAPATPPAPTPPQAAGSPAPDDMGKPRLPAEIPDVAPRPATKPAEANRAGIKPPEPEAHEAKPPAPKENTGKPVRPAPKAEPAKPPTTPGGGQAYLQVGVFASASNARQLADRLKAAGFDASVSSAGGKSKVRVGPFPGRAQAQAAQARLQAKGHDSVVTGP